MTDSKTSQQIVLIGIGGASSSGKTTLAKHLRHVLPNASILHQDDFAPPPSQIPVDPKFNVPNWEDAPHAVEWERFRRALLHIKETGRLPPDCDVREDLSREGAQSKDLIPVSKAIYEKWEKRFSDTSKRYVIVEGFLAFWYEPVDNLYDVRLFMRTQYAVVKARRGGRGGFALNPEKPMSSAEAHGHAPKDGDREFWQDPPGYFDDLVWPHYLTHHAPLFEKGDVEHGKAARSELRVVEGDDVERLLEEACRFIEDTTGV